MFCEDPFKHLILYGKDSKNYKVIIIKLGDLFCASISSSTGSHHMRFTRYKLKVSNCHYVYNNTQKVFHTKFANQVYYH